MRRSSSAQVSAMISWNRSSRYSPRNCRDADSPRTWSRVELTRAGCIIGMPRADLTLAMTRQIAMRSASRSTSSSLIWSSCSR